VTLTLTETGQNIGRGMLSGAEFGAIGGTGSYGVTGYLSKTYHFNEFQTLASDAVAGGTATRLQGGDFEEGAMFSYVSANLKNLYKDFVGYAATWRPGGKAAPKNINTWPHCCPK